jgi:predicted ATP-grasp superfamily ATP-dependent carboligase
VIVDEYYAGLAAVRALRAGGYEPWVGSTTPDGYAQRSRAVAGVLPLPSPSAGERVFIEAVAAAAASCGASAVLPGTESSVFALSGTLSALGGVVHGFSNREAILGVTDKESLAMLASASGLLTPSAVAIGPGEVPAAGDQLEFPAVVKPRAGTLQSETAIHEVPDAVKVGSLAELKRVVGTYPELAWLVQPFISGRLTAVAGVSRDGHVLCTVHQAAHRTFPRDCGVSAFAETVPRDEQLDDGLRRLHSASGLSGVWEAQFIAAADGTYLIDVNPRPYGSLALAVAAGMNLPAIWIDSLLGRERPLGEYRVGQRFRAEMRDLGFLTQALASRDLHAVASVLRPRRRTTHAVLSLRDSAPTLLLVRRIVVRAGA